MKRSEMLFKLADRIADVHGHTYDEKYIAQQVLSLIEDEGMLPPDNQIGSIVEHPYKVHCWESEE